jgi:hypothetical protein
MAKGREDKPLDTPVTNPMIEKLNPQPLDQRHFVVLIGYIGNVTADFIQVYPNLDLRTYYRIPNNSAVILYQAPINPADPSSPTKFVLDASTPIEVVNVSVKTLEAGFLAGAIADGHMSKAKSPKVSAMPNTFIPMPGLPICVFTQLIFSPVTACAFNTQCLGDEPMPRGDY